MSDVTHIMDTVAAEKDGTAADLLPLIYRELRQLAAWKLAREQPGQTLQATARFKHHSRAIWHRHIERIGLCGGQPPKRHVRQRIIHGARAFYLANWHGGTLANVSLRPLASN